MCARRTPPLSGWDAGARGFQRLRETRTASGSTCGRNKRYARIGIAWALDPNHSFTGPVKGQFFGVAGDHGCRHDRDATARHPTPLTSVRNLRRLATLSVCEGSLEGPSRRGVLARPRLHESIEAPLVRIRRRYSRWRSNDRAKRMRGNADTAIVAGRCRRATANRACRFLGMTTRLSCAASVGVVRHLENDPAPC